VLTAVNARSKRDGLVPGLGLADARAICPHLVTAPAAPDRDAEALLKLARWSSRYSPSLNSDGVDGLWLDAPGIPHLFGGEGALLADMAGQFGRLGFSARLAFAETLGGAHALARFARSPITIVPAGKIGAALAPLPVEALRLAPETAGLLKRLGLKRIGQLYDLPRASLQRRFHSRQAAEAVLLRLDQALGAREEPCPPLFPSPEYEAKLPFPEPLITHEGIVAGVDHLSTELCGALARARMGATRVMLVVYRADGSSAVIEAGLSAPCREAEHLLRLLQEKIATIDVGFGVDLMLLAAHSTEALPLEQTAFAQTQARSPSEPLIDRLANRLGFSAVRRLFPIQSHMPERAQKARSAFAGAPSWPEPGPRKPPRPAFLLSTPEPLAVIAEIPEGPPARFTWRRVTRRVVKAEGPERIAPEWWRELVSKAHQHTPLPPLDGEGGGAEATRGEGRAGWGDSITESHELASPPTPTPPRQGEGQKEQAVLRPRDYYRIEDEDGRRYWVFREGLYQESTDDAPCWYLHGLFG
jgi:protein ImuB